MKRCIVMLVAAVLALGAMGRAAELVDGVMAIVNDKVITVSDVLQLVQPVDRELRRNFSGRELEEQRQKAQTDALNTLIEHALIVQEFDAKGYKIPETYVEGQINSRIATEFGGNRAAFIKTLEAENMTMSQFRDQEREHIILDVMREQRLRKAVIVSPYKIEKYYQDHIDQFKVGDQVKLRMIYIKRGEPVAADAVDGGQGSVSTTNQPTTGPGAAAPATNAEAGAGSSATNVARTAETAASAAGLGASNSETSAAVSTTTTNALTSTGSPAPLTNSVTTVPVTNAEVNAGVATTQVVQTAAIATNRAGWQWTNSEASVAASTSSTVEAAANATNESEAVATNVSATVAAPMAPAAPAVDLQRKLAEEILAKLDSGESFDNMARVYSEGKEAKEGGDWGWIGRDILRKELNEVAFSLKAGQHSRMIETPEGYYILEVDDVKPAHTTPLAQVRDDIEKTLLQQERAAMQESWVKDLRAKAYIRLF
ncbi:MAG TPA: peptidyl-prolyl cis-trans isomerase [Verrucomicrobiae bacterium]|nr:peptidyl-prolyl cis-trans isomerase [Verrucomicrobiae bacterium]